MFWSCLRYRFPYFYFFLPFLVLCFPFPQSILPPFHLPNLPPIVFPLKITFHLLVFLINSTKISRYTKKPKQSLHFLWEMIHHKGWIFTNTLTWTNSGGKCLLLQVSTLGLPASETWVWEWFSPCPAALLQTCTCRRKHSFGRAVAFFLPQPSTPVHRHGSLPRKKQTERHVDKKEASGLRRWCSVPCPLMSPHSFSPESDPEHLMLQSRCVKQTGLNTFPTTLSQCFFFGRGRL